MTAQRVGFSKAVGLILAAIGLLSASQSIARAPGTPPTPGAARKEESVKAHAAGPFEVKLTPQPSDGSTVGRLTIDKQFHGDLEGASKGEMLTGMTAVKESAGYVAIEQVTGTLKGRKGTFLLQHSGSMARGVPSLTITVVPDSGTGELAGLAGTMTIKVDGGKHFYELEYTLSESP